MGFFDLFRSKQAVNSANDSKTVSSVSDMPNDVSGNEPVSPSVNNPYQSTYSTGMPIDLIYSDLRENYEQRGYEDALCNPDMSYKEMNISIIRHNLEIKFEQVILKYNDDLREIDFHIESRSQAGLVDVVEHLKSKREILQRHIDKLHEMESDFANQVPYTMSVILTYERGFLRGLAALSLETFRGNKL